jgi:hypothetical protein
MPLTDQRHTVRLPLPDMIVRDRAHTIAAPVYVDGTTAVTPASWSVAVYDPSNTSVETGTGSSSAASHTIGSGDLSSYALGDGWRVEWVITLSDGTVLTPRNDAMLVRCGLWPVVGDVDLIRRWPALDPSGTAKITSSADYQDFLDEAWTEIQLRLIADGRRPYLVMEPSALRRVHLYLAAALIFENEATRMNAAWADRAMQCRADYERAWSELDPRTDPDDSGRADGRQSASPPVFLSGGRRSAWRPT